MNLLYGIAYAQSNGGAQAPSPLGQLGGLFPIILMVVIFYFLLIRPQQKREKNRRKMISSLQQGDRVLTAGGMYATIVSIADEDVLVLRIADGTDIEFNRNSIHSKITEKSDESE